MKEPEKSEVECVSGGFINDVLGGMFHKDAHDGPCGLYGPGGGNLKVRSVPSRHTLRLLMVLVACKRCLPRRRHLRAQIALTRVTLSLVVGKIPTGQLRPMEI